MEQDGLGHTSKTKTKAGALPSGHLGREGPLVGSAEAVSDSFVECAAEEYGTVLPHHMESVQSGMYVRAATRVLIRCCSVCVLQL